MHPGKVLTNKFRRINKLTYSSDLFHPIYLIILFTNIAPSITDI
jgi:hypothetical protein